MYSKKRHVGGIALKSHNPVEAFLPPFVADETGGSGRNKSRIWGILFLVSSFAIYQQLNRKQTPANETNLKLHICYGMTSWTGFSLLLEKGHSVWSLKAQVIFLCSEKWQAVQQASEHVSNTSCVSGSHAAEMVWPKHLESECIQNVLGHNSPFIGV